MKEFLYHVFDHAGLSVDECVEIDERLFRPHEVPLLLGDATKAKEKLGWIPKVNLKKLADLMYESDLQFINKGEN